MKLSKACRVTVIGDRHLIETDARRAEAILLVLSGCTLQEVGDRFGITRERIRQYLLEAGLRSSVRTAFGNQPNYRMAQFQRGVAQRRARYEKRQQRIRRAVRFLRLFVAAHDRTPTYSELWSLLSGRDVYNVKSGCTQIASYLGRNWQRGKQSHRVRALYRLAGYAPRCVGRPGHTWHARKSSTRAASQRAHWAQFTPEQRRAMTAHLRGAA